MQDMKDIKIATLVDMLATHTNDYLRMLKEGTTEEKYKACKEMIARLIEEIESRKQDSIDTSGSTQGINFTKG